VNVASLQDAAGFSDIFPEVFAGLRPPAICQPGGLSEWGKAQGIYHLTGIDKATGISKAE